MYALRERTTQTPHGNDIVMAYREDTNDWNTLWATLEEDEYQLPDDLSGIALDIGGYLGSVGIALAIDNPYLEVIIVEPVPSNQDLIERNIAENRVWNRVHLVRGAVGRKGETVDVRHGYIGDEVVEHHAFVGNSTLNEQAKSYMTTTYQGLPIASLVGSKDVAFTKIDTEGAEYAFLDDPAVAQLQTIVGEYHPNRDVADLVAMLDPTHHVTTTPTDVGIGAFRAERR